jgi:2-polyprenyl-3-methyl-5-hydroxy-6-metoxy-1,4-benzoquinol methylase
MKVDITGRTAIYRRRLSVPVRKIASNIPRAARILDYGCGRGDDVHRLRELGFKAEGYDPAHGPEMPPGEFDVILCTYVLNVVDVDTEREILDDIRARLRPGGVAYLAVRRDIPYEGTTTQRWSTAAGELVERNSSFALYEWRPTP